MCTTTTSFEGDALSFIRSLGLKYTSKSKERSSSLITYSSVNFHINEEDLLSENPSLLFFQGYSF